MNRFRRSVISYLLIFLAVLPAGAEGEGRPAGQVMLFGGSSGPPVRLDSERGWIPVAAIDWDKSGLGYPSPEYLRKWRLRTSYEHDHSTGQATLQIRIKTPAVGPTFTHPWTDGTDRRALTYSNWYEKQTGLVESGSMAYVEARLIAPPRTPITGRLFEVTLEAWDESSGLGNSSDRTSGPDVQLAYVRPLPNAPVRAESRSGDSQTDTGPEASLAFALSFVESCLLGDLPSYYRLQADPVRSLDDGTAMAKYRLTPPKSIVGVADIDEYRRRFDYRIYDVKTFKELFPEWFDNKRPWTPGENAYLFMGHRDRLAAGLSEGVDYLVFMVEPDSEGNWAVVARPGR